MDGNADRNAHVRAARRRQAEDALAFEQDRESMLVGALEDVLAEAEGQRLDTDLFVQMNPDDVELVRAALGQELYAEPYDDAESDGDAFESSLDFDAEDAEPSETEQDDVEAEISRLQDEIESSQRVQAALGQYLELLSAPPPG